jgi:ABC-2 type transport system permease protein
LLARAASDAALTDRLTGAGLNTADAARALTAAQDAAPAQLLLEPPAENAGLSEVLGVAFAVVFFTSSMMFGTTIAQSVVEEKQSRVVEILVAAVPVRALLAGKVAANTALAVGQTALLLGVGVAGAGAVGQAGLVSLLLRSSGWFLLFFLLGFTMLATLWAASGAVASRQEDLQATMGPLLTAIMLPYFAALFVTEPGLWMRVLSYFPLTAPLSMPQRLMIGDAAWWEALLSAGVVVLTGAAVVMVAARLYEHSLLRTAGRTPWREAWRG